MRFFADYLVDAFQVFFVGLLLVQGCVQAVVERAVVVERFRHSIKRIISINIPPAISTPNNTLPP